MSSAFALKKNKYHIENRMIYVNTCFRNFFSWQKFHGRDYNRQVIDKSFLFGFSFHFDLDKHDVLIGGRVDPFRFRGLELSHGTEHL